MAETSGSSAVLVLLSFGMALVIAAGIAIFTESLALAALGAAIPVIGALVYASRKSG